jgi:hypothetical protein
MSHITDMLVLTGEEPDSKPIKALNAWCEEHANGQVFNLISEKQIEKAGGCKVFTTELYACAGNYFPWEKLIEVFHTFGWGPYTEEVTALILKNENVERWIGIHADGRSIGRTEKEAHRREPSEVTDGHVIHSLDAYWNAIDGRWVDDPDDATVFSDAGCSFMMNALRPQHPDVGSSPRKTRR